MIGRKLRDMNVKTPDESRLGLLLCASEVDVVRSEATKHVKPMKVTLRWPTGATVVRRQHPNQISGTAPKRGRLNRPRPCPKHHVSRLATGEDEVVGDIVDNNPLAGRHRRATGSRVVLNRREEVEKLRLETLMHTISKAPVPGACTWMLPMSAPVI